MSSLLDKGIETFGSTRRLTGVVYEGEGELLFVMLPDTAPQLLEPSFLSPTSEEWQVLLRQTDLMETEVTVQDQNGALHKVILRKCERQISQNVSWDVFRRDRYRCRYCGDDKSPLTVDHLVLWEEGGPSSAENLVACCKKCNATRGRLPYGEWLRSAYYRKVSAGIPAAIQDANEALLPTLAAVRRVYKRHNR